MREVYGKKQNLMMMKINFVRKGYYYMENIQRYKYKLETHLKLLCENNPEYENLYSSWGLNKTTYKNILGTIQINYPHYSLHDATHSESIITNIEMILGEERIKRLSPTDTWLILNCAYLHDFGMVLLYSNIEREWSTDDFQKYLKKLGKSLDPNLKEAANYIENLQVNLNKNDFETIWPLKIRKYVTEIISDYYRGKHSNLTKEYLNKLDEWNLDLTQNGLINTRLINLIGEISSLHTHDFYDVMKLDYISNGYNADYIHPRFIVEMIRLGDLLDLDNGRFNEYVEKVVGELPNTSKVHKAKHKATTHILVNPETIELRADCPNDVVYREVRNWVTWLDEEIKNISLNIKDIFPDNLEGYIPKLKKIDLLIDGNKDLEGKSNLKFKISQKKAFEIIEGSNIYENKITFIREFVQNALDASKIQLWKDLNNGIYDPWLKDIVGKEIKYGSLTPFELLQCKVFNNYYINIYINNINTDTVQVIIEDKGTGISLENLKAMCDVGESYDDRSEIYNLDYDIDSMPSWLRPTGGFGIGMQSGFLVSDKFKVHTKYNSSPVMEIQFEPATTGYISIRQSNENIKRGTKIEVLVGDIGNFKYSLGGNVDNFINNEYDVFKKPNLTFYSILDYVYFNICSTFFLIRIYVDGKEEKFIDNSGKMITTLKQYNDKYSYHLVDDSDNMIIWDKEKSIYFSISITKYDLQDFNLTTYFKGCRVEKSGPRIVNGFDIITDIYGFDTKESIQLNRNQLTDDGRKQLGKAIYEAIKFYLFMIKENISKISKKKIDIFKFIMLSSKYLADDFKAHEYKGLLDEVNYNIDVFIRQENGRYEEDERNFKEIYNNFPEGLTYLNIEAFIEDKLGKEEVNYNKIKEILNNNIEKINYEIIIADKVFIKIIKDYIINEIKYVDEENKLFIYSIMYNNKWSVKVDSTTKKYIIKKLASKSNKLLSYRLGESLMRCFIPAIEEYSLLAVNRVPLRVGGDFYNTIKIISPMTRNDAEIIKQYTNKDLFVESIVKRDDYRELCYYTFENQKQKNKYCIEEIDKAYQELIKEYYDEVNL